MQRPYDYHLFKKGSEVLVTISICLLMAINIFIAVPHLVYAGARLGAGPAQAQIRASTDDESAKAIGISLLGSPPPGVTVPTGLCIQITPNQVNFIYTFPVNSVIRVRAYQDIVTCKKPIKYRVITFRIKDSQTDEGCFVMLNKLTKANASCSL
jgi:hypothetical protein